jgi:uncharacterized protein YqjF (DUF2071 family)
MRHIPWVMRQTWLDLLFAHWPVDPDRLLLDHLPPGIELDTFAGSAWLTITPLEVRNLRLRALPPIPTASTFPELNVRTYVQMDGVPGVFFFSLDADSTLAVVAARLMGLQYRRASMDMLRGRDGIQFESARVGKPKVAFRAVYGPKGAAFEARPGSLDEWLLERYCLYSRLAGVWCRLQIDHRPWALHQARATIELNSMADPLSLSLGAPPLLHFSRRQDVVAWPPYPVHPRRKEQLATR